MWLVPGQSMASLSTDPSAVAPVVCLVSTSGSQVGSRRATLHLLKAASAAKREGREEEGPPGALSPFIRKESPSQKVPCRFPVCLLGQNSGLPLPLAAREIGKASLWHPYPKAHPLGPQLDVGSPGRSPHLGLW